MSLEIVVGPMFSGKSSYALSYIRRQQSIGKQVLVIKPAIDTRYSNDNLLVTHNREQTPCLLWNTEQSLNPCMTEIRAADCIVLDEAQFFSGLQSFVQYALQAYSKHILLVGLDGDSTQTPFGDILQCIPWATTVTKLCALCARCANGTVAPFTKRRTFRESQPIVDVGGPEKYESVCLKHLADNQ